MGTKNCPETPRQKMINMMYLVLTAMLALNVAAETLHAFKIVDKSLMKTYITFTDKNETLLSDFEHSYELNSTKAEKWRNLAKEVNAHSDSLVNFLIDTKEMLARAAGGENIEPGVKPTDEFPIIITKDQDSIILKRQDDLNVSPELMLTKGRGKELQDKVNEFRSYLSELVKGNPAIIANLESSLDVSDPVRDKLKFSKGETMNFNTWPQESFEASPVIASITLLSKLQIDVRNAESAVLRHLFNQIDASSFKFSGMQAKVIPEASYIFQGQPYKARIFLSAEDSTQDLEVYINGSTTPLSVEGNEAIYSFTPTEPGVYKYKGQIKYRNPDGDGFSYKNFEREYEVAKPAATISPTKMNLLYKGLKNPIDIAVPTISSDRLTPTCTNGKMYKEGDLWIIEPNDLDPKGENTKVIVNADLNGKQTFMGEMEFRVKKVPDPKATVAHLASGNIDGAVLRRQQIISADLEDFEFNLNFIVTSFDMSVSTSGYSTTLHSDSYSITSDQKRLINSLGPGEKVSFENIKAKIEGDPNDKDRPLSPIILTVQ